MKTFIDDYLQNPSDAIRSARNASEGKWYDTIDDEIIYEQLASPEFRLYEAIILSPALEDSPTVNIFSTVA